MKTGTKAKEQIRTSKRRIPSEEGKKATSAGLISEAHSNIRTGTTKPGAGDGVTTCEVTITRKDGAQTWGTIDRAAVADDYVTVKGEEQASANERQHLYPHGSDYNSALGTNIQGWTLIGAQASNPDPEVEVDPGMSRQAVDDPSWECLNCSRKNRVQSDFCSGCKGSRPGTGEEILEDGRWVPTFLAERSSESKEEIAERERQIKEHTDKKLRAFIKAYPPGIKLQFKDVHQYPQQWLEGISMEQVMEDRVTIKYYRNGRTYTRHLCGDERDRIRSY